MEHGSRSLTVIGLITLWMGNGQMKLGASFLGGEPYFLANLIDWGWRTLLVGQGSIATNGELEGGVCLGPGSVEAAGKGLG